ncbi:hypothetical protein CFC21_081903 [Triticum aestivum]|uniref:F-box associated domain-containing protein n=2 Tax=Triticum aestivum TaxID=4565 RepID=A0A9R1I444_WHEAT|nr:uncharacterized protein LOC123130134 [Triticum aestivum]KAF7077343.1 hypothetical protein CFC21_081903 [Triticum aestivum]
MASYSSSSAWSTSSWCGTPSPASATSSTPLQAPARALSARVNGAVLRDARVDDDFKVVLVAVEGSRAIACVYSSKTRDWGNLVSTMLPPKGFMGSPPAMNFSKMHSLLVGDSLYWLLSDRPTSLTEAFSHAPCLEFDVERQSLTVGRVSGDLNYTKDHEISLITEKGGGLGLLTLSGCNAHFWRRNSEHDGDSSWVLGRTIELDNLLSLNPQKEAGRIFIEGFAEYNHVAVLSTPSSLYTVQFQPLEVKKLHNVGSQYHAFESVCTAGNGGRPDAADVAQNA